MVLHSYSIWLSSHQNLGLFWQQICKIEKSSFKIAPKLHPIHKWSYWAILPLSTMIFGLWLKFVDISSKCIIWIHSMTHSQFLFLLFSTNQTFAPQKKLVSTSHVFLCHIAKPGFMTIVCKSNKHVWPNLQLHTLEFRI